VDVAVIAGLEGCKGDICAVHYKATPKASGSPFINNVTVITDIFKYNGSCIVEHWDSLQTADETTTNPLFPGA
jgi:predicted SnoaL-like aldol condensation-catalyzing enzyme